MITFLHLQLNDEDIATGDGLLLVRSHQAEIIIVKRFIQGRNNVSDEGGS